MQPTPNAQSFFAADQDWLFRVRTWDTPQTVLENNLASEGMRLRVYQPKDDTVNWFDYANALKAAGSNPDAALTNTTFATAVVPDGRWPLVQSYWGGGTPNWWGGSFPGRVAVHYSGLLVPSAMRQWFSSGNVMTFAAAGSGWLRIDVVEGGTRTTLFAEDLTESRFLSDGFTCPASAQHTFSANAELHLYYVQTQNDPWGGLVVKAIPGARPSDPDVLEAAAADAPVVGAGLFSHGAPIEAVELPFIMSASITHEPGSASKAEIEIPLINPVVNDGDGWVFFQADPATDPGVLRVYEAGELQHTLKRKRMIQVQVARKADNPEWSSIFTGHVDDFSSGSNGRLTIRGVGLEGRMVEQFEQAPDRISYMARGFRVLDYADVEAVKRKQPVYNVPAFDNWPLAWAVEELSNRAGIDPSRFRKPWQAVQQDGSGAQVVLPWGDGQLFRANSLSGEPVRLPRPVQYGNVGLSFTENRPFDDEYVFKVEPTKDLWARSRELTDRLGYVWRFDANGAAALYPANSPSFVRDLVPADASSGTAAEVINPAAFGAKYLEVASGTAATLSATVRASRIDVSLPRVANARAWTVTVAPVGSGTAVTKTITPSSNSETPALFFDSPVTAEGANGTVFSVFSGDYGDYVVTLSVGSGTGPAYVDCILGHAQDPDLTKLPVFSTAEAAQSVATRAQQDEVRNKVTIVGRRKGAVTDSDKFAEAQAPTEQEFVVQNAVDVNSIVNPDANNYVGYLKQSVIYDESIADDGLARYLAQVFIYRQSVPRAGTSVSHTLLPMVEPGDPIAVEETHYTTASPSTTQYVRSVTHRISNNSFVSQIESEAWPDYPAYQPRTDINLADFDFNPVVGMAVDYRSISGHTVTNPSEDDVKRVVGNRVVQAAVPMTGSTLNLSTALPWPPVPGTLQVRPRYGGRIATTVSSPQTAQDNFFGNFSNGQRVATFSIGEDWRIDKVTLAFRYNLNEDGSGTGLMLAEEVLPGSTSRQGYFYYEESDGRLDIYRGSRLLFNGMEQGTYVSGSVTVLYRVSTGDRRSGWVTNNPYHRYIAVNHADNAAPRVTLPWEQLTGRPMDNGVDNFDVRYISLFPDTSNTDPNGVVGGVSFSPFYDPYTSELGNLVSLKFSVLAEGLYRVSIRNWEDDTVVAWLTNTAADATQPEQHWEYLPVMSNKQFTWDGVDQLGLWNGRQSELYSELVEGTFEDGRRPRVGRGFYAWNQEISGGDLGPLAYIWMARNPDGTPIIGQGTYSAWYVHVEARTTTEAKPLVTSRDENVAVLTHLPEPTKLELSIQDQAQGGGWQTPTVGVSKTTVGGYINNDKPVRIRFRTAPRPGVLWAGKDGEVSVKLTREVHLRVLIGDQVVVFRGSSIPGANVEDRAIYNRRLVNDEHTKQYVDSGYRKAKTFRWTDQDAGEAITEWVFKPSDFKKDFRIPGFEESVEFGNYLQIEEVPEWNGARAVTAARSRLNFALMSYLFYLSAYVTDRSGRSSWGINRSFVDKSKIFINSQQLDWPLDPMYEQRRTVICRQWTDEQPWKAAQLSQFLYPSYTLYAKLLESFWHQHDVTATTIGALSPVAWSSFDLPTDNYSTAHLSLNDFRLPSVYSTARRQLGGMSGSAILTQLGRGGGAGPDVAGGWSWESSPAWVPSITRDLHPFFLLPPMVSPPRPNVNDSNFRLPGVERNYDDINCFWTVGGERVKVTARSGNTPRTITVSDAGGSETWSSPVMDFTGNRRRFWPGQSVDAKQEPFKADLNNITNAGKWLNYVRQDEMVHFEDLRGVYSRSTYPGAAPVKVAATSAYFLNPFRYPGIEVSDTLNLSGFPLFHVGVNEVNPATSIEWFRIAFRSEYVWESGSMFPTARNGRERLEGVLWWRHRFLPLTNNLFYDFGAWTGWKDDNDSANPVVEGGRRVTSGSSVTFSNPFSTGQMPFGTGPVLPQTMELTCHLVLLPERRGS